MPRKAMSTTGISVIATVQARRARNRRRFTGTPPSRCASDFHDDLDYQGRAVQWRLAASRNPSLIGRPGARAPAPSQGLQTFEQPSQPTGPPISLSDCIGDFVAANGSRATSAVPTDRSLTARFSRGLSDRNWLNPVIRPFDLAAPQQSLTMQAGDRQGGGQIDGWATSIRPSARRGDRQVPGTSPR
jgi:hypothetical protein